MFEVLKDIVLFRNTSLYILAFDTLSTTRSSQTTAFLIYATIRAVREDHISTQCSGIMATSSTDTPLLTRLQVTSFHWYLSKRKQIKKYLKSEPNFFLRELKNSEKKAVEKILLDNNTGGGEVMLRMIKFSCFGTWVSNGLPSCVEHILTTRTLSCALYIVGLAPPLLGRNYCVRRGLSVAQVLKRNCVSSNST
jgi:hypothetical protein